MLADNDMDLHSARLAIWHCAWVLDQGHKGRHESSLTKVLCSEAQWRVVDRSVQVLGASGWQTFIRVTLPSVKWALQIHRMRVPGFIRPREIG